MAVEAGRRSSCLEMTVPAKEYQNFKWDRFWRLEVALVTRLAASHSYFAFKSLQFDQFLTCGVMGEGWRYRFRFIKLFVGIGTVPES